MLNPGVTLLLLRIGKITVLRQTGKDAGAGLTEVRELVGNVRRAGRALRCGQGGRRYRVGAGQAHAD
jgi:hypothetical protein